MKRVYARVKIFRLVRLERIFVEKWNKLWLVTVPIHIGHHLEGRLVGRIRRAHPIRQFECLLDSIQPLQRNRLERICVLPNRVA